MNNVLNNLNIPVNKPEIIKINDNNFISICKYEKRIGTYFEVIFNNSGEEFFIGRYIMTTDTIKAAYNNGKIMVYSDNYNKDKGEFSITKVRTLYDILDDTFYSLTEQDALNLFDPNLDSSRLKKPNQLIVREDIDKIKIYTK